MKKPLSESRIAESRVLQEEGVYTLKISNFNPQLEDSSFLSNARYSHEQKIMKRREMVQTATSRYDRKQSVSEKSRRTRSSQQVRMESDEKINKLKILQQLNQEIQILTPILDEKIGQLKNFMYRKSQVSRRESQKEQNVHFTEYVLQSAYPSAPTVLHSRTKKECPFMKSVKARNLMNKSAQSRPRSQIEDLFKSIQLNNSSKYASSKRIAISGDNISKSIKSSKNNGKFAKQVSRSYVDRRQSLIAKRQRVLSPEKKDDDCRPWETHHRLDVLNEETDLIQI